MLGTLILLAVLVYAGLCIALFVFQRSLIYFPQPATGPVEAMQVFEAAGAQLKLSTRPAGGPNAVLYFGGNAEDVSANLPTLSAAFPDHAIYLLHYRGYGGSSGSPTEAALHADAAALFDKIRADHPNIVVIGRSLGTGVAVRLASSRPVSRLVLVTPYDSLQELAAAQFPYFPVRWMLSDKFESWRYAPAIKAPTLILLAEHDEVIPRASTELLLTRFAKGVAVMKVVQGVGHNTISESAVYLPALTGRGE